MRAYDADDLEQWLEQAPAVALQFGEEIGLIGPGVESLSKHWTDWSRPCNPLISFEALLTDRHVALDQFVQEIRQRLVDSSKAPYIIKADSVEEAASFVCAALLAQPDLDAVSLVVTSDDGWRFVAQNTRIKIVLAARPEITKKPAQREGLILVIPYAAGDMSGYYPGTAGRGTDIGLTLKRPDMHEFEKALISIGIDEAEAKRLGVATGRSWSVLRRRKAVNPAIRRPAWLDAPQASTLSTVCLIGGWSEAKSADREVVASVSGRRYEELERDLRDLSRFDDAPVVHIGEIWKAKSPLELLDLFGDRITRSEIDRFLDIAKDILAVSDPILELPEEKRYAAQIYGKVRSESPLLIETLCDTLIKLSVWGTCVPGLSAMDVSSRVSYFVHTLLHEADGVRWLSLSSLLPQLAEAAPDVFLTAIEHSLGMPGAPVLRLISETGEPSVLGGQCWHAGLLWALETLAWAPDRLTRVTLILARLSHSEIKGNWGNTPAATLVGIFRSWFPQTGATVKERIEAIDTLITREPDIAFDLLDSIVHRGPDSAHMLARPRWRDEDVGAGRGVTSTEIFEILTAAADRLISLSNGNASRIARLIDKVSIFDAARTKAVFKMGEDFANLEGADEEKEVIRTKLRKDIHWHRNYGKVRGKALDNKLRKFEHLYLALTPKNPVVSHRWLFDFGWPQLPISVGRDYDDRGGLAEAWRLKALKEIYKDLGFPGIESLAHGCQNPGYLGSMIGKLGIEPEGVLSWLSMRGGEFAQGHPLTTLIAGLLRSEPSGRSDGMLAMMLQKGKEANWDVQRTVRFLLLAPEDQSTWDLVTSLGEVIENSYWSKTRPGHWLGKDEAEFSFVVRRLLCHGRPRTAFEFCHFQIDKMDPLILAEIVERLLKGEEPAGPLTDSWHLGKVIDCLESSDIIERNRLIRLEFALIPALGLDGEQRAKMLYEAIMSDPQLFAELLCLIYKPHHKDEKEEPPTEQRQRAASVAWTLLHNCRRQPGTAGDGNIEGSSFSKFIDEVRKLCEKADRSTVCDLTLGNILAHCPADADGTWPCNIVRDFLEHPELSDVRRGFITGIRNKRGVITRGLKEGGIQERTLSDKYHRYSRTVRNTHPYVAAALDEVARSYEKDGTRADVEAELREDEY